MKKAFKIIVPILLSFAVLASMAWYFLIYDSSFTQELLLGHARYLENKGNHSAAVWMYNLAYSHSGEDGNVAIELAEQYKGIGNYTKAEFTLSNAIADGGTAELYIALSKTYVEQDKLLDAVRMLDNIADPTLKAELDSLRPAAPTLSSEPGFYNECVELGITAENGTLYFTTDGNYPTTDAAPYDGPVSLGAGETKVLALAVGENGLVSPLTIGTYTVVGVIEPITFQDPAIEALVRKELNYSDSTVIYTNDLWGFTEFTVPEDAAVYSDLAGMINLKTLSISNAKSADFSFIANLQSLESLSISGISLDTAMLNVIATPANLTYLSLTDCTISSIIPLANLKNLVTLDLSNNSIRDLSALVNLLNLEELYLQYNAVRDLGVVTSLPNLKVLDLSYNDLSAVPTIGNCATLEKLDLTHNKLTDISAVAALTNLTHFAAADNRLSDISALQNCTHLAELDISNNTVKDISVLGDLVELAHLNFSNNLVEELPWWPVDCALISIDGSYNLISNIDGLADFYHLNHINMDYNADIESVAALEGCPALVRVDVYGTRVSKISDVTALTEDRGIIVNFTPEIEINESEDEEE